MLLCFFLFSVSVGALTIVPANNHEERRLIEPTKPLFVRSGDFSDLYIRQRLITKKYPLDEPVRRQKADAESGLGLDPLAFLTQPVHTSESMTLTTSASATSSVQSKHTSLVVSSHSIIGTPGPITIPSTAIEAASTPLRQTDTSVASSSSTVPPVVDQTQAPSGPPPVPSASDKAALSEWKIIGTAVIAFSAVATVILGVVFFDQWWAGFLRPMIWKSTKMDQGAEELVPDWDKRSWRIGIEDQGGRYPSIASFPSVFKLNNAVANSDEHKSKPLSPFPLRSALGTQGPWDYDLALTAPPPTASQLLSSGQHRVSVIPSDFQKTAVSELDAPEIMEKDAYGGMAEEDTPPHPLNRLPSALV